MEINLQDIIKQRIEEFEKNPQKYLKVKGKEYNKKWNEAVEYFRQRINKDMRKEKRKEYEFMPIRMKLQALREIDDLRWFYRECLKYAGTYPKGSRVRNTFSKAFFGALKCK